MAKKKAASTKKSKAVSRRVTPKAKASANAKKVAVKRKSSATKNAAAKIKVSSKKKARVRASAVQGSQDVEIVHLKPKSRVARAGAGTGDLQGISIVEDVDSESPDELLEEGQSFEAGIVKGVEDAGDAEESEVITHEVLQDDVPQEYDDDDRP
jgi:hypothetical protein